MGFDLLRETRSMHGTMAYSPYGVAYRDRTRTLFILNVFFFFLRIFAREN
jgi:hypothetical protein